MKTLEVLLAIFCIGTILLGWIIFWILDPIYKRRYENGKLSYTNFIKKKNFLSKVIIGGTVVSAFIIFIFFLLTTNK